MKTSDQIQPQGIEQDLENVRELFEQWREHRKRGARIPDELWQAAVSLFPRYNVNRIARALRLSHADVRDRIETERNGGGNDYRFRELRFSELEGHIDECRLRAEDGTGRKVELELKSIGTGHLMQLLEGLWGER
ncbi:MAG: hypothetical protein ACOC6C_03535 [Verrucomicrobiota bacterium]